MRVLQILTHLNDGGSQAGTIELAKALVQAGHESFVVSSGGALVSKLERCKSKHITLPIRSFGFKTWLHIRALRKLILELKPDIIHVRSGYAALFLRLALSRINKDKRPVVVSTLHLMYEPGFMARMILKSDAVICVSNQVLEHTKATFPEAADKLICIPRGIDPKIYPYRHQPSVLWWNNTLAEFPELESKIWLTLPGKITYSSGHQWLLDVLGGLKGQFPDLHAVFIGEPRRTESNYFTELQTRIEALGLSEHVTFTGAREDTRDWLSASNLVFDLSNKTKGSGRYLLKALFLGTPVIAWSRGGVKEIMSELYPQGLVEPEDCLALCSTVKDHLEQLPRPPKPEKYHLKPMTDKALTLYKELLAKKEGQANA